jgi:probable O-glycosylation ligase (exosortase A-associated)
MNPHRLAWGVAHDFEFAAIIAVVTMICALFSKDLKRPPINSVTVVLALFIAWTGVSTVFALHPDESYVIWKSLMKTQIFAFLILMLIHTKERVRELVWVLVISIGYYGTKGGVWTLLTGGAYKIWGPEGSYIEDNNALAVAIIVMIPMMRYLQLTTPHKSVRWGLTIMMLSCGISALGTYSRGALLAVIAMVVVLWWKTRYKLVLTLVSVAVIPLALNFMPDQWHQRMGTISTYEQDKSANSRFYAWNTMFNIAKDRPLVGGGFDVATEEVYQKYSTDFAYGTPVAHSIYFQAMGEHGFVGLGLYLLLLFLLWWNSGAVVRLCGRQESLAWASEFGRMMQVSIIGFAVGGAFLSLVNYDVPYYLAALLVATSNLICKELQHGRAVESKLVIQ